MRETSYDVVLYGASGFVGKQTVRYFAERVNRDEVRWAIAGRSRQKLELVRAEVGIDLDILVADSQERAEIDSIVSQTRVLLNTAGPFALQPLQMSSGIEIRFRPNTIPILRLGWHHFSWVQ